MKWFFILLICFSVIFFQSCSGDDSTTPNTYAAKILSQLNTHDTFLVDLPPTNDYVDSIFLAYQSFNEKWLNLRSLRKGYDSIEIRLWYGCYIGCGDRLIRLTHNSEKWQAEISNITRYGGGDPGPFKYFDSLSREIEYKSPKSGWVSFINNLFALHILTLPDDNNIPNFERSSATDGEWVQIEISTRDTYRFYGYDNPGCCSQEKEDKYWQVKNVLKIIRLLSTEFNISEWPEVKSRKPLMKDLNDRKEIIQIPELNLDSIEKTQSKRQ